MVLRCTRRLLDLLGGRTITVTELPPANNDWYANLIWFDRQKCLLLTHAGRCFQSSCLGYARLTCARSALTWSGRSRRKLRSESLPDDTFGQLNPDAVCIARTASRRTLGFMNEMAVHLRYQIADAGGLSACDPSAVNNLLRRTLHNRGGYVYPIELVAQWLATRP